MLEATGRHPMRAPHLHFMISAPGRHTLVTQLFVEGGDYLDADTVFGVKGPLIVPFATQDGAPPAGAPSRRRPGWLAARHVHLPAGGTGLTTLRCGIGRDSCISWGVTSLVSV